MVKSPAAKSAWYSPEDSTTLSKGAAVESPPSETLWNRVDWAVTE